MNLVIEESDKELLRSLVYGQSVSVNISSLSKSLNKHRNTIQAKVNDLFKYNIITRPFYPFIGLFKEYPFLILTDADLLYNESVEKWFVEDPNIFAAFRSRYSEYNTLLILYHKDMKNYELWREKLSVDGPLALNNNFLTRSSTSIYLNDFMIKYNPNAPVYLMEEELKKNQKINLSGYNLDNLDFKIIKLLLGGKCIKINESQLSNEFKLHRSTILRRTQKLIDEGLISNPVCRFPNFYAPLGYILAVCKLNIKSNKAEFIKNIRNDPHITMANTTHSGGYNLLLFAAFRDLDEELKWEVHNSAIFPECFDKIDVRFYSLAGAIDVGHQKISLAVKDEKYMYFRI